MIINFSNNQSSNLRYIRSSNCYNLSDEELSCIVEHKNYLDKVGVYDVSTAISFCDVVNVNLDNVLEEAEISNGITIEDMYLPSPNFIPSIEVAGETPIDPRLRHIPPAIIADDMRFGYDGDTSVLTFLTRPQLSWTDQQLIENMYDLMGFASMGEYTPITDTFMQRFISSEGGIYENRSLSFLIANTNQVKNKIKLFGQDFEDELERIDGNIDEFQPLELARIRRYIFGFSNYGRIGPTILINDVVKVSYYLQFFDIDPGGNWIGLFYVDVIDHFGLDDKDPNNKKFGLPFQFLDDGFASWWILQRLRGYRPFRTNIKFLVRLSGQI